MKTLFTFLLTLASMQVMATIWNSDGSSTDVQAKINSSANGDTVTVPSGGFAWSAGVTNNKAIVISGAGSGRIEGHSVTSLAIGTGTKAFVVTGNINAYTNGETVKAVYLARGTNFMQGTVTSWSGGTLTLNVTTTGGSGTFAAWNFIMPATTIITNNCTGDMILLAQPTSGTSMDINNICFVSGNPGGSANAIMHVNYTPGGSPILLHDIRVDNTNGNRIVALTTPGGGIVMWHLYCNTGFRIGEGNPVPGYGIAQSYNSGNSWTTPSTFGNADTTGLNNTYCENSYFSGLLTECFDSDNNSRLVVRYSTFDNSGITTHGADSSNYGNRHFELSHNAFLFDNLGTDSGNLNYFVYFRGGTALIHDNFIADINSGWWGDKSEIYLTVGNLTWNIGPNPLWGSGGSANGQYYHCPRQVGFGYVTGSGTAVSPVNGVNGSTDSITYVGDSEPVRQWNNTGAGNYANPGIADYQAPTGTQDSSVNYIKQGRDYTNAAPVSYVEYTYPHPLDYAGGGGGGGGGVADYTKTPGTLSR